jgi:hypothetical protein
LWSERYDRELADVFAVQDEIAAAITGALHVKLSPSRRRTPSLPAYEQYLKALFHRSDGLRNPWRWARSASSARSRSTRTSRWHTRNWDISSTATPSMD